MDSEQRSRRPARRGATLAPLLVALAAILFVTPAQAGGELSGHLKAFFVGTFPYEHLIMPPAPTGSATLDGRMKLSVRTDGVSLELHPTITGTGGGGGTGLSTGVGLAAPEALPLSADLVNTDTFALRFRIDRASASFELDRFRFTFGRQPITFGTGALFTPMDLVAPFAPTSLDSSYKPGVDSARADVFFGTGGRVTMLAAYLGEWGPAGSAFAAHGQFTIVTVELALFVASLYGDAVLGASVYAPIGPLGLYGDATLTFVEDEPPELRGVVGVLTRPGPTTTLTVEVYGQTFGTTEPSRYFVVSAGERYARGELWLGGHLYLGAALGQEITPLINLSVALISNLLDPSVMLMPSLSVSLASNADLSFGGIVGIGQRPDDVELADLVQDGAPLEGDDLLEAMGGRSEFGTLPVSLFAQGAFYF